jgi:glutamate-1-semialdehyde 2,1-aminomutase
MKEMINQTIKSQGLFQQALSLFPGGVNSPVRAFKAVGGKPLFIQNGQGAYLYDVDGNAYIDYVLSWGPLILGHAHPLVVAAIQQTVQGGTSFGAPCPQEIELARLIQEFMPSIAMIRFVNSGTEATMSAIRLARAYTGRNKIIKFEGCYHGHADMLLVQAGSGVATFGLPDSPGVPAATAADTLVAVYNDLESVKEYFFHYKTEIAAIIVEPVAGNMGVVPPQPGFLQGLREITAQEGALLIFDEVMSGFRVHPGGAQAFYQITPDLTTLGKVIGGGLPIGAYGGKREIMEWVAPVGAMYQAGTLSGNPLVMSAGIATLKQLQDQAVWQRMEVLLSDLEAGIAAAAKAAVVPIQQTRVGTMFTTFFSEIPPINWQTVKTADTKRYARYFQAMLAEGVYLAPSQFEAGFFSTVHGEKEVERTSAAARKAMKEV